MFESAAAELTNAPLSPPLLPKATATLTPARDAAPAAHTVQMASFCHYNGKNWLGNACHFNSRLENWRRVEEFLRNRSPASPPAQPATSRSLSLSLLSPSPWFPAPPPAVNGSLAPPTRTRLLLQPPVAPPR
ncbi:hypothetical protein E2C01_062659 [Portunus trituberculatus]|uniref:Uncharacterized protein n=1 Tax=Portunus trituberculatus TaxID=210409 RepID=A0A5B7HGP3_PORTR|nr:hypothetical protein [Portunus trituberculatus]